MLNIAEEYIEKRDHIKAFIINSFKHSSWTMAQSKAGERLYMTSKSTGMWSTEYVKQFRKLRVAMESIWHDWSDA